MERNKLYLAWQDPENRSWSPVGILALGDNGSYRFVYTEGARESKNFVPFARMTDLDSVYESKELFPLFSNRVLSESRPEYRKLLRWLDVEEDTIHPLDALARTGGTRATDSLELFWCPVQNSQGQYEAEFFVHGLRYLPKHVVERVNHLSEGDRLFLVRDVQNEYDPQALALRTEDPVEFVGYCPRYLSPDFVHLLEKNNPTETLVTVARINGDAPLNLRLLCRLVASWPPGFRPCSDKKYEPLADSEGASTAKSPSHVSLSTSSLSGDLEAQARDGSSAKSTGTPASPCAKDLGRLKCSSSKSKATPVIAKENRNGISYTK